MSLRRLATTTVVMAVAALLLAALTPELPGPAVLSDPQGFADEAGPDALVVAAVGLSAWVAWGWGALGLLLTALSAAPGLAGALARGAGRLVLPESARRAAAVALGVGLTMGVPALSACSTPAQPVAAVESLPQLPPVPDWPIAAAPSGTTGPTDTPAAAGPVPDWPAGEPDGPATGPATEPDGEPAAAPAGDPPGGHVVVRGDCLWEIAAADLRARTGTHPAPPDVSRAVAAWWTANRDVIGPDPDLLLPGQVLRAPAVPTDPAESETRR
ncbi:LysM peptidoglycan-binding domain-containing protein [Trujillonella endophytica]|uniref:LysM domain-containing protein n=1 Tax=Trujillonella endophytica TaxID=673521 RepID=A0A1H8RYF6_9ACTN|nr:LysM domain-containing protein [Trujillella endophytica]SEO71471.1 hypothetical protein SAMN05660991_01427 [Trujillella endophytica]